MNGLYIEFRDPLFGVIVFFLLIFVIALVAQWWRYYRSNANFKTVDHFIHQFHSLPTQNELQELIGHSQISRKSWFLLAQTYTKTGDFEKSIEIYHSLFEHEKDQKERLNILFLLGKTYFKAGFLERAKELFIKILSQQPRSPQVLHYLLLVYEQLHEYQNAMDVLEPLDELGEGIKIERIYLSAQMLLNDAKLDSEHKVDMLVHLYKEYHNLSYLIFEYLFKHAPQIAWLHLDQSQCHRLSDILWRLERDTCDFDVISQNSYLRELFSAKGYMNLASKSDILELDILIKLQRMEEKDVTLQFEYLCQSCKQESPFSFHRCPQCYAIDSVQSIPILAKAHNETHFSFQ